MIVADNENAKPQVDGHVASLGVVLHYDLPQFPNYHEFFSLGRTRFQTPSDKHVLLAAILAPDGEEFSSSNQSNCGVQPGLLKANDPPVLHLVLQLFALAS